MLQSQRASGPWHVWPEAQALLARWQTAMDVFVKLSRDHIDLEESLVYPQGTPSANGQTPQWLRRPAPARLAIMGAAALPAPYQGFVNPALGATLTLDPHPGLALLQGAQDLTVDDFATHAASCGGRTA